MGDAKSNQNEFLKAVFGPTPECLSVEHLERFSERRLSGAEAARSQAHLDTCLHCRHELEMFERFQAATPTAAEQPPVDWIASQLRGHRPARPQPVRASWWETLAAWFIPNQRSLAWGAALVVVLSAGLFLTRRTQPSHPVYQGDGDLRSGSIHLIAPTGRQQRVPAEFRWSEVSGARIYRVELFDVTGAQVWTTQTSTAAVAVPPALVVPGRAFGWKVSALDSAGRVLSFSLLQNFDIPLTH